MSFPSTGAILADVLGAPDAAAYDLSAGCTGFMYALAQAYGMIAAGLADRALVIGGDVLSRILDWTDRSTVILFGDGAGAVVLEKVERPGFLGFELGADGGGGIHLSLPGSGSRRIEDEAGNGYVHMNGREVFKFATRVLVSSAKALLERCGFVDSLFCGIAPYIFSDAHAAEMGSTHAAKVGRFCSFLRQGFVVERARGLGIE